jgi:hypothetical protein
MGILRRHLSYANVASTLALVFAMGGGAYAALAPVRAGVIHSCLRKSDGALRVVSAKAQCGRRERPLAFNQRGRVGRRGPLGPAGPIGRTGARGKAGPTGKTGATGRTGPRGTGVTSATLGVGNAACPGGGSSFTSVSGTTFACSGSAVGWASVDTAGSLTANRNVSAVALGTTPGIYCLKLATIPAVGVASVRGDAATHGSAEVLIPAASAACGASGDTTAEVLTFDPAGNPVGLPFDVLFD